MTDSMTHSALMMDHAAGRLTPALALVVDSHITLSEDAMSGYRTFEAVGGALLDGIDTADAPVDSLALDHIFARIERGDEHDRPGSGAGRTKTRSAVEACGREARFDAETMAKVPAPIRAHLPASLKDIAWKKCGGGVREFKLPIRDEGFQVSLLSIDPGRAIPSHTHGGTEYTVVLDGAYTDDGENVVAGDLKVNDARDTHKPVADPVRGCLCLAVLNAPLRFRGPLGFILNQFQKF